MVTLKINRCISNGSSKWILTFPRKSCFLKYITAQIATTMKKSPLSPKMLANILFTQKSLNRCYFINGFDEDTKEDPIMENNSTAVLRWRACQLLPVTKTPSLSTSLYLRQRLCKLNELKLNHIINLMKCIFGIRNHRFNISIIKTRDKFLK